MYQSSDTMEYIFFVKIYAWFQNVYDDINSSPIGPHVCDIELVQNCLRFNACRRHSAKHLPEPML